MTELATGSSVKLSLGTVERIAGAVFLLLATVCAWVVIEIKSDVSKLDDRLFAAIERQSAATIAIKDELTTIKVDVATIKADVANIKTQPRRQ